MDWFLVIFLPPVYLAKEKKWIGFIFNSILYVIAIITLPVFGLGVFFWMLAVGQAAWDLRTKSMRQQATMIAEEMTAAQTKAKANNQ